MITTGFRPQTKHTYKSTNQCSPRMARGPLFNVGESKESYHIELAIPGWAKEQISIESKEGHLFIKGKADESKESEITMHRRMFGKSDFQRSFLIPDDVDQDQISAKFDNGILYISLKKDIEKVTPKSIKIQ